MLRCQQTTITALSDARDKEEIKDLEFGLNFLKNVRPVQFIWNTRDGAVSGVKDVGFIAQELDTAQNTVSGEDYLRLVYKSNPERIEATPGRLIPVAIKAIQELADRVATLEAQVAQLQGV